MKEILYAIPVVPQAENPLHENRPSHGLVFSLLCEKTYTFSDGATITTCPYDLCYLPYRSTYTVSSRPAPTDPVSTAGMVNCFAINFTLCSDVTFPPFNLRMKNFHAVREQFETICGLWFRKPEGYRMKSMSLFYELLYQVQKAQRATYLSSETRNRLLPAMDYLSTHYPEGPISVPLLAELSGMSEVYFRRLFSQVYGTSPVKYINSLRIARAKELILSGFYSISEVSVLCGFHEPGHFIAEFKKATGMTPSAYRDSLRNSL